MRAILVLVAQGALLLATASSRAQEIEMNRLSYRLDVDFIQVTAVVTDSEGRFVPGLTREDFEIREDGKPQEIAAFTFVDLPRRPRPVAPDGTILEPEIRTNDEASGRLFVLLIDDLRTPPADRARLWRRGREFVDILSADDLAAVVFTSGIPPVTFTTDQEVLLGALAPTAGRGPDDDVRDLRVKDIGSSLKMIEGVAALLESVTGRRKTVVYFGPGSNYDLTEMFGRYGPKDRSYEIMTALEGIVGAANRGGVSIYAVHPQGLVAPSGGGIERGAADEVTSQPDSRSELAANFAERESLHFLAEGTGGFAVYDTNGFAEPFDRIMADNSRYYLLAYYPSNEKRDGKDRTIDVRVRDRSLTVRARKGYRAPRGKRTRREAIDGPREVPSDVMELLRSPVPIADLPLRAVAARTPGGEKRLTVALELDVSALELEESEGRYRSEIAFGFLLLGDDGAFENGRGRTVRVDIDGAELTRLRRHGLRVLCTLPVKPGRHQVAIAARERKGGRSGLLYWYVESPPDGSPSLADIVISSAEESAVAVVADEADRARLRLVPTTRREFASDDELWLHAPPGLGSVTARVLRPDGSTVHEARTSPDQNLLRVSLARVEPGDYVLELVDAQGSKRRLLIRVSPTEGSPTDVATTSRATAS